MNRSLRVGLTVILFIIGWNILYLIKTNREAPGFAADHIVEVRQMAFTPSSISVKKGDRITFINRDIVMHDITEKNKAWQSHPIGTGKSWTLTVTRSADYYCSIHPVMRGRIIVK